ncbi:SSS family solute:Na+ symporter [Haloferula luteola]|uniref:SSS family solute:Na+ symporter n=1 Tax=Haloferula luteola TaxID=595692 RepID=A0A840V4R8_9BACT|nr:sodium:solute symporter [Haloferula luteola]MBB5352972.1 SSS family solute:Na+ symporter [Haloferula luteola]
MFAFLAQTAPQLSGIDWTVIGLYFCLLVGIVYWSSKQQNSTADYFLAGRHAGWFVVGCSIFASNIGSEHIVGLAGSGANNGLAQAHWEMQGWVLLLLAWFFIPFYYSSGVFTMPEFLEKRFDARSRWVLSIVSLIAYVFTKVAVTVYAGAIVFKTLLPDTFGSPDNAFWVGAFTTVFLTGIYTVFGGLRAVIYTEVAQTIVLLTGAAFITYFGLDRLGGWGELVASAKPEKVSFALWRPLSDMNFPWLGVMISSVIIGTWYWCTDQYIVQRCLAAKNLQQARRGAIWGGALKMTPVFIFLVPGMIGWALHKKGLIEIPVENGKLIGDQVFPTMVATLLPPVIRGLVVAGLMSALMSSLASLFNSCATLFTVDIYEKLRPGQSDKKLVNVGRIATVVVVGFGFLWIPIMKKVAEESQGLYDYLQGVQGYIAPPIFAVFILGIFWKRINATGAFVGLTSGFVAGMIKLTIQTIVTTRENPPTEGILAAIGHYNQYYAHGWLTLFSVIVVIAASLATPAPAAEKTTNLTFSTMTPEVKKSWKDSIGIGDYMGTIGVIIIVAVAYLYFSFWLN